MRTSNIEVGEVGRIRLVQVEVALIEGRPSICGNGCKEMRRIGNMLFASEEMEEQRAIETCLAVY